MPISIINGRDTRQIISLITRLLKNCQKFYKKFDHVVFFPYNIQIPTLHILPRLPQQQVQFVKFLNQQKSDILFVFCTSNSYKKLHYFIDKQKQIMVAQKNGQNLKLQGDNFIGLQSIAQLNKIQKSSKTNLKKYIQKMKQMKKGQILNINQESSKIITF